MVSDIYTVEPENVLWSADIYTVESENVLWSADIYTVESENVLWSVIYTQWSQRTFCGQ